MNVCYRVELNQEERDQLNAVLGGGKRVARKLTPAQILLAADAGQTDAAIAANVSVGLSTVYRTKRCFVVDNLEAALTEAPRPGAARKLSDKQQALLVATACAKPPPGRRRWTLELLAGEMVKLTDHEALSRETVRRCLAEHDLNRDRGAPRDATHRVVGGGHPPPTPTERSVRSYRTTLLERCFTVPREPASPGRAAAALVAVAGSSL
jgi:transposase